MDLSTVTTIAMTSIGQYGVWKVDYNSFKRKGSSCEFNMDKKKYTVEVEDRSVSIRNNHTDRHIKVDTRKYSPFELADVIIESLDHIRTHSTDKLKNEMAIFNIPTHPKEGESSRSTEIDKQTEDKNRKAEDESNTQVKEESNKSNETNTTNLTDDSKANAPEKSKETVHSNKQLEKLASNTETKKRSVKDVKSKQQKHISKAYTKQAEKDKVRDRRKFKEGKRNR